MRSVELHTEKIENIGWIAYPAHVLNYANQSDRVMRATGRGRLRRDALTSARTHGEWIDTSASQEGDW